MSQLEYCLQQLMDPSTKQVMPGREAEAAQIEGLLRNRLAMPQKVNAVSCWEGLEGINQTVADMTEAIQQKQYFGQLGELIPESYKQLIERVKVEREANPTMRWAEYAALGKATGIKHQGEQRGSHRRGVCREERSPVRGGAADRRRRRVPS